MAVVSQAIWGSIVTGSLYALVGVGFVVLFRASKVLSFCQGGFMLLGAFLFYDLVRNAGVSFVPALLLTVAVVSVVSAFLYLVVFARVAAREPFTTSVATIGLAGVLQAIVAVRFGTAPLTVPEVVGSRAFQVAGATVRTADLFAVGLMVVVVSALLLVMAKTPLGLRMNAVADNTSLSVHLGISAVRVAAVAWGLAGMMAALAGVAFSLRAAVDPIGVANIGLIAFPAIIMGGLESVTGAIFGGLLLGALQNAVILFFGTGWVDVLSFAVMLAFLLVRPTGLFGKPATVRL